MRNLVGSVALVAAMLASSACALYIGAPSSCEDELGCPAGWACTADGRACTNSECGNGILDPGEICDDGNVRDGDGCSRYCRIVQTCGNGFLDMGEQCDDGNQMSGDGCSADCRLEEPCQGHACPDIDSPFQLPEGGEIRLELYELEVDDLLAGQAFFFRDQAPAYRPFDGVPITDFETDGIACSDYSAGIGFDNGYSPEAQAIADTRTYVDLGDYVTLTPANDSTRIVFDRQPPGTADGSSGLQHDILYMGNSAAEVQRNSFYTPAIAGSAEHPALDLRHGESIAGEYLDAPRLFFPNAFTLETPTEAEYYAGLEFTEGQDFLFTWTPDAALDPAAPVLLSFAAFVDTSGQTVVKCFKPDDGELVVPAAALERVPPTGSLLLGRFSHLAYENVWNGTRVDLLGVAIKYLESYTVRSAP